MQQRTIPFHYGLFYNAMVNLLGREPDFRFRQGFDGYYAFRYEPRDEAEARKFADHAVDLKDWLKLFEITPLDSCCEFGRLPHPQEGQDNKDYLYIYITHPVERKKEK